MSAQSSRATANGRIFKHFVRRSRVVSMTLTSLMLAVYFGFILLMAFGRDVLLVRMDGGLSLGIPVGMGIILTASMFTGIYVWWANTRYDVQVRAIVATMQEDDHE